MRRPAITGHRGSPERETENTALSFRAALEDGAQVIETDIRLTADGHLVISHDPDFSRLGGPEVPIARSARSDLEGLVLRSVSGRPVSPLFMDRALEMFRETAFNVDLKDSGRDIVAAWCRLLVLTGAAGRCRTASFRDRTLRIYRRMAPGQPVSVGRFGVLILLVAALIGRPRSPRPGEGVIQVPEKSGLLRILSPARIDRWRRRGWKVEVWTVDDESDMRRLVDWGVDAIITNRPASLRRVLESISFEEHN